MNRHDKLPSGRETGEFLSNLSDGYRKVRSIVKTLLTGYSITFKEDAEGLAYMNHDSKSIVVNPLMYLSSIDPMYDTLYNHFSQTLQTYRIYDVWTKTLHWGLIGIVCHEIGHALYTLSPAESAKYLQGCKAPEFFIRFCSNVVEDSYIQNKMKQRYKWDLIKDGLDTSTAMFQGLTTCEDFSKKSEFTIQDKLFYFILRSYNPNFAPPAACVIPQELIDEFLSFYYSNDSVTRFKCTVSWSEKLYDWLKEEIETEMDKQDASQSQVQGQQGNGSGSGGTSVDGQSGSSNGQSQQAGTASGSGKGSGTGGAKRTAEEIAQAIKDVVKKLEDKTGVGSGSGQEQGTFDPHSFKNETVSDTVAMCNGIFKQDAAMYMSLNDDARAVLSSYNLNFRRLQVHSFNGTSYNQSSGRLNKHQLYKSSLTPKIFTRETGRKRDMDLYFGITLDASGSMGNTYYTLVDIIVPLIHSLNGINSKSEMLVFSDDTYKIKDYYDTDIKNLYSTAYHSFYSCGTDLLPSLKYFSSIIRERNHKDKCIVVVTDGQTDHPQECVELVRSLRKYNTCVVGIGLRLGDCTSWFYNLFGEDALLYNTSEEIQQNIATDLVNFLSNKFMRR